MYRITKTNQLTKKIEVIDIYINLNEANIELDELHSIEFCRVNLFTDVISPIVANERGLSFCTSRKGEHFVYQVEYVDEIVEAIFDIFKPYLQN
jgi:hypothetical protein